MIDKLKGLLVVDKFFERTPDGPLLVGSKCKECGKVYFPRKKVCYKCFKNDTLEVHPINVAHEGPIEIVLPVADLRGDSVELALTQAGSWIMLSEVEFEGQETTDTGRCRICQYATECCFASHDLPHVPGCAQHQLHQAHILVRRLRSVELIQVSHQPRQ